MKKVYYIILLLSFFSSCSKEPIITENKDLSFIVFAEEVLCQPLSLKNEFRLLTKNQNGVSLISINADGTKKELLALSTLIFLDSSSTYENIFLLPSNDFGNYIIYSFYTINETDSIHSVGIIKTDNSGKLLWQKYSDIQDVNGYQININSVYHNSDDGITLIFNSQPSPALQKYIIKVSLFDALGNNTSNYISNEIDGNLTKIYMSSNEKIYIFPKVDNHPKNSLLESNIIILNKHAELVENKPISFSLSDVFIAQEIENNFLISGTTSGILEQQTAIAILLDTNFNILFQNKINKFFSYYAFLKIDSNYLAFGAFSVLSRKQFWNDLYTQTGYTASWFMIDYKGVVTSQIDVPSEFSTIAIAAIPTSSNSLSILAVRKSFEIYKDLILIKTNIE